MGLSIYWIQKDKIISPYDDGYFNVLVLGSDVINPESIDDWHGRSDLILAIIYQASKQKVSLITVPRDCKIYLKRKGAELQAARINSLNLLGGYELARKSIGHLLGIKFDRVVVFSITGFEELINKIGYIEINVPKRLSYHDSKQNLNIEIPAGRQLMNGETLIKFLRYRDKDQGDIGRIKRQQIFFRAAIKKLGDPKLIARAPDIVKSTSRLFLTDMSPSEILRLGNELRSIPKRNYSGYLVPGDFAPDGSWAVKRKALRAMMSRIIDKKK